jgi:hypothetical protein
VITADEVMPLLLVAVPSFDATWAEIEEENNDSEYEFGRLHYLDAAAFARHLVARLETGETDEVRKGLAVVERFHVEGNDYVRELATIGYLEDLQNYAARSRTVTPADFVPLLGSESTRWWRGLDAFWSGAVPPPVRPID